MWAGHLTPPGIGTSFKYTGQRQAEAGLYFYNARWYDTNLGRFIQADSIIPSHAPTGVASRGNPLAWDRYAYGMNSPINFTDPSGHKACENNVCSNDRGSNRGLHREATGNEESKPPEQIIPVREAIPSPTALSTPVPYAGASSSPISITATPTLSTTQTPFALVVTQTPTAPLGWTSQSQITPEWMQYIDKEDLVWDVGGIIIDLFTIGSGGRVANGLQVFGKGYSVLSVTNNFKNSEADYSNDRSDWYEPASIGLSIVGIAIPIYPDAIGITINFFHAIQLTNENQF